MRDPILFITPSRRHGNLKTVRVCVILSKIADILGDFVRIPLEKLWWFLSKKTWILTVDLQGRISRGLLATISQSSYDTCLLLLQRFLQCKLIIVAVRLWIFPCVILTSGCKTRRNAHYLSLRSLIEGIFIRFWSLSTACLVESKVILFLALFDYLYR